MTGSLPGSHPDLAKVKLVAVPDRLVIEVIRGTSFNTDMKSRATAAPVDKLTRATHEVGMNMGFKHMRYRHAVLPGLLQINIGIRPWIDNGCTPGTIVTKEIGDLGNAIGKNGIKSQSHFFLLNIKIQGITQCRNSGYHLT